MLFSPCQIDNGVLAIRIALLEGDDSLSLRLVLLGTNQSLSILFFHSLLYRVFLQLSTHRSPLGMCA